MIALFVSGLLPAGAQPPVVRRQIDPAPIPTEDAPPPCEIGIVQLQKTTIACGHGWQGSTVQVNANEGLGYACIAGRCRPVMGLPTTVTATVGPYQPPVPGNCYQVEIWATIGYEGDGVRADCNDGGNPDCCVGVVPPVSVVVDPDQDITYIECECP